MDRCRWENPEELGGGRAGKQELAAPMCMTQQRGRPSGTPSGFTAGEGVVCGGEWQGEVRSVASRAPGVAALPIVAQ